MIQDIFVYIIIGAVVAYIAWSLFSKKRRRRPASCGDCTSCSCELADLKKECEIRKK